MGVGTAGEIGGFGCVKFKHGSSRIEIEAREVHIVDTAVGDYVEVVTQILEVGE